MKKTILELIFLSTAGIALNVESKTNLAKDSTPSANSAYINFNLELKTGTLEFKFPSTFMEKTISTEKKKNKTQKTKETKKITIEQNMKTLDEKISEIIQFEKSLNCKLNKVSLGLVHNEEFSSEKKTTKDSATIIDGEYQIECDKEFLNSTLSLNFNDFFPGFKKLQLKLEMPNIEKSLYIDSSNKVLDLK